MVNQGGIVKTIIVLAALAFATAGNAATITGLVNTGAGVPLSSVGTVEANWKLTGGTAFVSGQNGIFPVQTNWLADDTTSRWITPTPAAGDDLDDPVDTFYTYTLDFSLAGFDAASAVFAGRFAVDNVLTSVTLNGISLGASGGGFSSWTNFASVPGSFVAGNNQLAFVVNNIGQDSGNPGGLRVEFTSSNADAVVAAVPEPASWAMLIGGFGLAGGALRRRRVLANA